MTLRDNFWDEDVAIKHPSSPSRSPPASSPRRPPPLDSNNRQVGGGTVVSFAFNSDPIAATPTTAQALQSRQWSLTDTLGTSSAAVAEFLIYHPRPTPPSHPASPPPSPSTAPAPSGSSPVRPSTRRACRRNSTSTSRPPLSRLICRSRCRSLWGRRRAQRARLHPHPYQYWSVVNPPTAQVVNPTDFIDGGSLENTGLASAVSYADIDSVILKGLVDWEYEVNSFPNYSTMSTQLSGTQINLLSNFTCWIVQESSGASAFTSLFTSSREGS